MNKDETIKEILENIKKQNEWKGIEYFRTPLSNENVDKLLDYITNLQEENEKLKEELVNQKDAKAYWHVRYDLEKEKSEELEHKIDKAKCSIASCNWNDEYVVETYNILEGEENDKD